MRDFLVRLLAVANRDVLVKHERCRPTTPLFCCQVWILNWSHTGSCDVLQAERSRNARILRFLWLLHSLLQHHEWFYAPRQRLDHTPFLLHCNPSSSLIKQSSRAWFYSQWLKKPKHPLYKLESLPLMWVKLEELQSPQNPPIGMAG